MEDFVGIKELYDVNIRLLKPLEIGKQKYDMNESILSFKTAEIAQIQEQKRNVQARGGLYNPALINWEIDREISFGITHGVLSPTTFSLLSNSMLKEPKYKSVQYYETIHTIEDGNYLYADLKYIPNACGQLGAQPNPCFEPLPMGRREELMLKPLPPSKTKWIFIYDAYTGRRIHDFSIIQNRVFLSVPAREIIIDYTFTYEDKIKVIEVGNRLINGFLKLDGKMSVKDENSGEVTTAILELPKIKLSSSLSLKLGSNYQNSIVSDFYFTGYLEEGQKDGTVAKVTFLDKELTGDYI